MARWRRDGGTRAERAERASVAVARKPSKRLIRRKKHGIPLGQLAPILMVALLTGLSALPAGATTLVSPAGVPEPPPSSAVTSPNSAGLAKSQVDDHGKGSTKARHGKAAQKPVKPFVEPASAVATLLASVGSDEHQLMGLNAYADAQGYIGKAETGAAGAASALASATAVVGKTRAAEARAIRAELAAKEKLDLDQSALYELGMAEYTGQAATAGTDLASEERQVQFAELTKVAAIDEGALFQGAQIVLTATARWVNAERIALSDAVRAEARAKIVLTAAQAQLTRSRAALLDARTWATVPGEEPSQPLEELVALESGHAKGDRDVEAAGAVPDGAGRHVLIAGDLRTPAQRGVGLGSTSMSTSISTSTSASTSTSTAIRPSTSTGPTASSGVVGEAQTGASGSGPVAGGARSEAGDGAGAPPGGSGQGAASAPGNLSYLTGGGPTIIGSSVLSASQIAGWFASTGAVANAAVPMAQLAKDYIAVGKRTGVRGDVAFAQSVLETGYFSFPGNGEDPAEYNNFAGIGACGSCKHGWKFSSAREGVLAQENLLGEYAGVIPQPGSQGQPKPVSEDFGVMGCCRTWMSLSGVWASNPNYGYDILSVYKDMLDWVVSQELQTTGLVSPQVLGSRILRGGA